MKRFILLAVALLLPVNAFGGDVKPYVSVGGALVFQDSLGSKDYGIEGNIDFETGGKISTAFGLRKGRLRGEAEFSHRNLDWDGTGSAEGFDDQGGSLGLFEAKADGDMNVDVLMFNGYYDIIQTEGLSFYLGAGVGVAWEEYNLEEFTISDQTFEDDVELGEDDGVAYQLMAGATATVTDNIAVDLQYAYFEAVEAQSHELGLNLRYTF